MDNRERPIFFSYARIDDHKGERDPSGWIKYFHDRLKLLLDPKLGTKLDFWRDVQEIEKGAMWHAPIKVALQEAHVLLAVLSPSFLKSDNCSFELQHFLDCHANDGPPALAERVVKVVKHEIELTGLPPLLREVEAFDFFIKHPEKGELSYFTPETGQVREDKRQAFMDELERLANRLVSLLAKAGDVTPTPVSTVYVAIPYPGSKLTEFYHCLKAELERLRVKVLPDRKQFFDELDQPNRIRLEQAVTNARLVVHLLDPTAPKEAMSVDQKQLEATAKRAREANRLQRLIWIKSKSAGEVDNDLVASLRSSIDRGGSLLDSDRLMEEPSQRFIELLIRTLFPGADASKSAPAPAYCYLDVHTDDEADVRDRVIPELQERGFRCRRPVPLTLKPSDRVAIYWGRVNSGWIFNEIDRLKDVSKLLLVKGLPSNDEKVKFLADEVAEQIDLSVSPAAQGEI